MKRTVTATICTLIFAMSLAACGKANESEAAGDNVQIPAPWTDYATVAEAEEDNQETNIGKEIQTSAS